MPDCATNYEGSAIVNTGYGLVFVGAEHMTAPRFRLLFLMMCRTGKDNVVRCSVRELAEGAGISTGTVIRAVRYFEELGVIERLSKPQTRLRLLLDRNFLNRGERCNG
jgi:DNA-binding MarR family transcriptional regulator